MAAHPFQDLLNGWRDDLREVLCEDPQGHIGRPNPACAENVTAAFPDPAIIHSYVNPLTCLTHGHALAPIIGIWPGLVLRMIQDDISAADVARESTSEVGFCILSSYVQCSLVCLAQQSFFARIGYHHTRCHPQANRGGRAQV
jgi:hypothetical protein